MIDGNLTQLMYYNSFPSDEKLLRNSDLQKAFNEFVDNVIYCVDSAMNREELIQELKECKYKEDGRS